MPGYYDFIDAISAPDNGRGSRKKREMLAWYGRPYDPSDIEDYRIKAELARTAYRPPPPKTSLRQSAMRHRGGLHRMDTDRA